MASRSTSRMAMTSRSARAVGAPAAVAIFDRQMRYLAASARWIQTQQIKPGFLGRSHYVDYPEFPEHWKEVHRRAMAGEAARQERESAINLARAYQQQVLERARGDTSAFDQIYAQYELAPEVTRKRLYYETMENVLSNVDKTIVEARGVTPYLPLNEVQKRAKAAPAEPTKGSE